VLRYNPFCIQSKNTNVIFFQSECTTYNTMFFLSVCTGLFYSTFLLIIFPHKAQRKHCGRFQQSSYNWPYKPKQILLSSSISRFMRYPSSNCYQTNKVQKRGHNHFWIVGLYRLTNLQSKSTPPIPSLYW